MRKPLEDNEIKSLKKELKIVILYSVSIVIFFFWIFILALKGSVNIDAPVTLFVGVAISVLVLWLLGFDTYRDLKSGKKDIIEKILEIHEDERKIKISKTSSVVNSWGRKSKKKKKKFLIHVDNATFEVSEEFLKEAEVKGVVKLHYTLFGNKLLKIDV